MNLLAEGDKIKVINPDCFLFKMEGKIIEIRLDEPRIRVAFENRNPKGYWFMTREVEKV